MKKVITVLLLVSLLSVGCFPAENQLPTAYIDSISPTGATEGQTVTFTGHGTDADGTVVAWRWTSNIDGQIGTTASFTTSALSAGAHTISLTVQDNSDGWSEAATYQFTVGEAVGMEEAVDKMVKEILPEIPETQNGDPWRCVKLDAPLPPGTEIIEDSGSTVEITTDEEVFFFYLDLAPNCMYAHPVKYILVNSLGNHEEYDAEWWPRIDDEVYDELVNPHPDARDVIASEGKFEVADGMSMVFQFPGIQLMEREGFIVVQGLMPDEALHAECNDNYINRINFWLAYASGYTDQVEGLVEGDADKVLDTIDDMVDDGMNVITLDIVAHGNYNFVVLGGYQFTANQFRNKIAEYPDVKFNFLLASCHSGSFMDNLDDLDNVYVVATACDPDEGAWPDYDTIDSLTDYDPSDNGIEWNSAILSAMSEIVGDSSKLATIYSMSVDYEAPVTSVLICQGAYGAVGANPGFGLSQDLDLCSRAGWETPQSYCSFEPAPY
jgi:hypothetical protein